MNQEIKEKVAYELSFCLPPGDEVRVAIIEAALLERGVDLSSMVERKDSDSKYLFVYFDNRPPAENLRKAFRRFGWGDVRISVKTLREKKWQDAWKKEFRPFQISESFDIVPAWRKDTHRSVKKRTPIYIDTSVAFGTGLHETTQFMVDMLDQMKGKYETLMDIGTGTGILAIAACYCGAREVYGLDISEDAVRVARENFERNSFEEPQPKVRLRACDIKKLKLSRQFDYVAANLITHDLMENAQKILSFVKPDKYLAVSGISKKNYRLFREVFDKLPLKCLKIHKGESWVAVLYQKR